MLSLDDGKLLVRTARAVLEAHLGGEVDVPSLPEHFKGKRGVFVTLHTHPDDDLRGCIGFPLPFLPLDEAVSEAAISAGTRDPRFPPVRLAEMDRIIVEVSALTPPETIETKDPKDREKEVVIGRDGLIIKYGMSSGLLLPQVPVELGWDVNTFLEHTCIKAGLTSDMWLEPRAQLQRFQAQVFSETSPRGEVIVKEGVTCGQEGRDDE